MLSHLRQPLPTPDSCSLQLILSAPEDRGLAGSDRPAGCQAAGTCIPGRGLSKPGSPQGSAPSRVPRRLVPGGGVGREMLDWSLEHLLRGGAEGEPRLAGSHAPTLLFPLWLFLPRDPVLPRVFERALGLCRLWRWESRGLR